MYLSKSHILRTEWAWQLELLEENGGIRSNKVGREFGGSAANKFLEAMPSTLAINVTNTIFTPELYHKGTKKQQFLKARRKCL